MSNDDVTQGVNEKIDDLARHAKEAEATPRESIAYGPKTLEEWKKLPSVRETDPTLFMDTVKDPEPYTEAVCLLCTKKFEMLPSSGQPDPVCPECWRTYHECAIVICRGCRTIIGKITPKVLENGYIVQKRQLLHTKVCFNCAVLATEQGYPKTEIVEIKEWEERQRPTKLILPMTPTSKRGSSIVMATPKPVK